MKKITTIICIMLMTSLLLAGCSGGQSEKITQLSDLDDKTVALMAVPVPAESLKKDLEEKSGAALKEVLYFDTFQAAFAALKSGKADAVFAMEPIADFYTARDESLTAVLVEASDKQNSYRMALRAEDMELLEQINAALLSWAADGTLDALADEFITGLTPDMQLAGRELPHFDNAPTLHVGLSGDNPPVDYVAADGKPAGYNVELLYKLSEELHVNFEISVMPLETKFSALASNKIDIFFLHIINYNAKPTIETMEKNNNISLTEPYYTFDNTMLVVLK